MSRGNALTLVAVLFCAGLLLPFLARAEDGAKPNPRGAVEVAYHLDRTVEAYRTAISSADSEDTEALSAVPFFALNGKANLRVSVRSTVASETNEVTVLYYYRTGSDYYLGRVQRDVTSDGTAIDPNDDFDTDVTVFDGMGASHVKVLVTSIGNSGTLDLWVGSF